MNSSILCLVFEGLHGWDIKTGINQTKAACARNRWISGLLFQCRDLSFNYHHQSMGIQTDIVHICSAPTTSLVQSSWGDSGGICGSKCLEMPMALAGDAGVHWTAGDAGAVGCHRKTNALVPTSPQPAVIFPVEKEVRIRLLGSALHLYVYICTWRLWWFLTKETPVSYSMAGWYK